MTTFIYTTRALLAAFSPGKAHHTRNTFAATVPLASLAFAITLSVVASLALAPKAEAQFSMIGIGNVFWTYNGWSTAGDAVPTFTASGGNGGTYVMRSSSSGNDWQVSFNVFSATNADLSFNLGATFLGTFNFDTSAGVQSIDVTDTGTGLTIHVAIGTGAADSLTIPNGRDAALVFGLGGNDTITASSFSDTTPCVVFGGGGNDTISAGWSSGTNYLHGDWLPGFGFFTGSDYVGGGNSPDFLAGGPGGDNLDAKDGNDLLLGQGGDDFLLVGGDGDDIIDGGGGNDTMHGGLGNDTMIGGTGNDTMFGEDGEDDMTGGTGNDWMEGGDDTDQMFGEDGNDTMLGGGSTDIMDGGAGMDDMFGEDGNDSMFGGTGDDLMRGGDGDDDMHGGAGDDAMDGGDGADVIGGDEGNDFLHDDDKAPGDQLVGGDGDDQLFSLDTEADILAGGNGNDFSMDDGLFTDVLGSDIENPTFAMGPLTGGLAVSSDYTGSDPFMSYVSGSDFWGVGSFSGGPRN